jgi:purine-binding chemotaxis protein CheW
MTPRTPHTETAPSAPPQGAANGMSRRCELLVFRLGAKPYGVEPQRVREIRSYEAPARVAGTGDCIRGVLNLRGVIVPIVDARRPLRLAAAEAGAGNVLLVLALGHRLVGLVVDALGELAAPDTRGRRPRPRRLDIDKLMVRAGLVPTAAAPRRLQ